MIPKIIHYCWFSQDEIPEETKCCIQSWIKWLPEFKIKKWTLKDFDVNNHQFTQEALLQKKWAFLTDYVRHYALYHYGGIYLDSDVMLYGPLNSLFDSDFVSACEYHPSWDDMKKNRNDNILNSQYKRIGNKIKVYGIGIQAAVIASIPKHPLSRKVLDFYDCIDLETVLINKYTAPTVLAYSMEEYGFRYIDEEQKLQMSIHLYPTSIISNHNQKNKKSIAVHWCAGSWINRSKIGRIRHELAKLKVYRLLVSLKNDIQKKLYK